MLNNRKIRALNIRGILVDQGHETWAMSLEAVVGDAAWVLIRPEWLSQNSSRGR